mgnify:CR=1 FL=1
MNCATCRWFKPLDEQAQAGECHANAPVAATPVAAVPANNLNARNSLAWCSGPSVWPIVHSSTFCGDFKPKLSATPTEVKHLN